jgi:hypothetical protein
MFDEIHCKEFKSVAGVIFGASNSTGTCGFMSRGIKKPSYGFRSKVKRQACYNVLLVYHMLHSHIFIANALTDKV